VPIKLIKFERERGERRETGREGEGEGERGERGERGGERERKISHLASPPSHQQGTRITVSPLSRINPFFVSFDVKID
jgi:hypothetical protein